MEFQVPFAQSKRNRNFDLTQCVMADVTNAVGPPHLHKPSVMPSEALGANEMLNSYREPDMYEMARAKLLLDLKLPSCCLFTT